jgi:hypothetical protein
MREAVETSLKQKWNLEMEKNRRDDIRSREEKSNIEMRKRTVAMQEEKLRVDKDNFVREKSLFAQD